MAAARESVSDSARREAGDSNDYSARKRAVVVAGVAAAEGRRYPQLRRARGVRRLDVCIDLGRGAESEACALEILELFGAELRIPIFQVCHGFVEPFGLVLGRGLQYAAPDDMLEQLVARFFEWRWCCHFPTLTVSMFTHAIGIWLETYKYTQNGVRVVASSCSIRS